MFVLAPPKWITEPNSYEGFLGSTATIHCQAVGFPTPTIQWTHKKGICLINK